jgi:hypothetical protein
MAVLLLCAQLKNVGSKADVAGQKARSTSDLGR